MVNFVHQPDWAPRNPDIYLTTILGVPVSVLLHKLKFGLIDVSRLLSPVRVGFVLSIEGLNRAKV